VAELSRAIARLMDERSQAQPQTEADPPRLRDVIELVRSDVAPGERTNAEAFVRLFFGNAGSPPLDSEDVTRLAMAALAAFRFMIEPRQEEQAVAVFDPDLESVGWDWAGTVIHVWTHDRPFVIDTVRDCLRELGCSVRRLLHPVLAVERDARGTVLSIAPPGHLGKRERLLQILAERTADPPGLAAALRHRLADVVTVTEDYAPMRARLDALIEELRTQTLPRPWNEDAAEVAAFLEWLTQKHFVFLGYREYDFAGSGAERTATVRAGSGLGLLRHEESSSYAAPTRLPDDLRHSLNEPPLLIVSKTNAQSPVHRAAHMDYVGIKKIGDGGVVVGERRLIGLFTSKALAENSASAPLLRQKLETILATMDVPESSEEYENIVSVFGSIPKTEALASPADELGAEIGRIVADEGSRELVVVQRPDATRRGLFVVALLPHERFSHDLVRRMRGRLLRLFDGSSILDERLVIDENRRPRVHFYVAAPSLSVRQAHAAQVGTELAALLRTWDDELRDELGKRFPREQAKTLADRYLPRFPEHYKADTEATLAVHDIECLEALQVERVPQVDVSNDAAGTDNRFTCIKLFLLDEDLVLSDFLPVLENLGLRIFGVEPLSMAVADVGQVQIKAFLVQDTAGARLDVARVGRLLKSAVRVLHGGRVENDRLNALITSAGLDWRQVDLLRTYVNHGRQIGSGPSREALVQALVGHPRVAEVFCRYFTAKFDPHDPAAPRERSTTILPAIEKQFLDSLDEVQTISEDTMLRCLLRALTATRRTNFFQRTDGGRDPEEARQAIAIKLASTQIPHLANTPLACEVYVHAPHVEGVHLRGSSVARGGIRVSDRAHDFRDEILELMQTQMVKNAVIVPAGAKGGLIAKCRPGNAPTAAQVLAAYQTFIGALLDVTDNVVDGSVTPQTDTVVYDDPDPYLVVAADKGTATFADVANEIATQRRFWLGDAFASGGANGYDHKKEGITARGAWECVRRHFREMGRDAAEEDIDVIGIGDMSGDVFGNGLLLSRRFRLRAAFNHQHVFLDPNPDPTRSYAERQRLFRLPHSVWSDYDTGVLSEGGGVFSRGAKKIVLHPTASQMLELRESASGEEVIRAILRMEADLLWNGGIGTYVKARAETHAEVGDGANDNVRVDAADLRVAVVGEGGNLGFTARARAEYALQGGRINTDAIDNSAGVDMSDHEVNVKSALAGVVASGQMTSRERNELLAELAPEVTARVLAHNLRQARVLSLDQRRSQTHLSEFRELMSQVRAACPGDRQLKTLPDRDTLRGRRSIMLGLTRPELALLLAHGKLQLQQLLLDSSLPDDPFFERYLRNYFPEAVNQRSGAGVRSHRLRREIIAVEMANALTDTLGSTFVTRIARDTGSAPETVVRAWAVIAAVSDTFDLYAQIGDVEAAAPLDTELACWTILVEGTERATKWIIATQPEAGTTAALVQRLSVPLNELLPIVPEVLSPAADAKRAHTVDELAAEGIPPLVAERVVLLDRMAEIFEIAHVADEQQFARRTAAEVYYRVDELLDLEWVRERLLALQAEDRWERRAVAGLTEGLMYARRQLTIDILRCEVRGAPIDACLRTYADAEAEQLGRLTALVDDIKSAPRVPLAAVLVIMRELGRLVGRPE
jgi:glutamate dehydrogenase